MILTFVPSGTQPTVKFFLDGSETASAGNSLAVTPTAEKTVYCTATVGSQVNVLCVLSVLGVLGVPCVPCVPCVLSVIGLHIGSEEKKMQKHFICIENSHVLKVHVYPFDQYN